MWVHYTPAFSVLTRLEMMEAVVMEKLPAVNRTQHQHMQRGRRVSWAIMTITPITSSIMNPMMALRWWTGTAHQCFSPTQLQQQSHPGTIQSQLGIVSLGPDLHRNIILGALQHHDWKNGALKM
ncbi:hypothetical protein ABBQ38_005959 [Trebouxia sp. C0009 RCD-2024]